MSDQFTKQLNTLIAERDAHNTSTQSSERERRHNENLLASLRSNLQQLADQLNVAKSAEGEVTRKLQNLADSKTRLGKSIEVDRGEIVRVANELRGKEKEEKDQMRKFVKEMEVMNDEHDALLCKVENGKMLRLLDAETIRWLLESELFSRAVSRRTEGMDEDYKEAENEKWRGVQVKIEEAAGGLMEAGEKIGQGVKDRAELEKTLKDLREKFASVHPVSLLSFLAVSSFHIVLYILTMLLLALSSRQDLGPNEINSLESKWEETIDLSEDTNDPSNDGMTLDGQEIPSKSNERAETDPVHMELFYQGQ